MINLKESKVEVDLESLLHHTASRILDIKEVEIKINKILSEIDYNEKNLNDVLHCKWGFDGSSGQSEYKQVYSEVNNSSVPENSLF